MDPLIGRSLCLYWRIPAGDIKTFQTPTKGLIDCLVVLSKGFVNDAPPLSQKGAEGVMLSSRVPPKAVEAIVLAYGLALDRVRVGSQHQGMRRTTTPQYPC